METAKAIIMDVAKTTISVMAVNALGVPQMVRKTLGDKQPLGYGVDGVTYALSSDIVDYFSTGHSKIINMQWFDYADDIVFMGAVSAGSQMLELPQLALSQIHIVSPLSEDMNFSLVEGLIISTARIGANLIDSNPNVPSLIKNIRHPSHLIR